MKKSFLSLLAVATMVSCTQNDMDLKGSSEDQVPVLVSANALSIESGATTRAPFNGPISMTDSLVAKVLTVTVAAGSTNGDYSSLTTPYGIIDFKAAKTKDTIFGFKTPLYYPVNPATEVALVGLYPQTANFVPSTAQPSSVKVAYDVTVTGCEDLMVAPEKKTKKADIVTTGTKVYPTLDFVHLLTRLDIKVVAKDSASYNAWGEIQEISVMKAAGSKLKNVLTVNLVPTTNISDYDPIAKYSGTVDSIPCYVVGTKKNDLSAIVPNYTDSVLNAVKYTKMIKLPVATLANIATPSTDAKEAAYAMIVPFDATSNPSVDLKIVTKNSAKAEVKKIALTLGTDIGSVESMRGKKIVITLTFIGTEIVAKASVEEWKDGGTADDTIQ